MPGLKRTKGGAAVMAQRAAEEVEADTPEQRLFRKLNFFPTAPWGSRAGAELIRRADPTARSIWEPACGAGHMSEPAREYFPEVRASDIYDHGCPGGELVDFLDETQEHPMVDWVFTNPPFSTAAQFARIGMQRARRGVALLCRLQFEETETRAGLIKEMAFKAPFAERVPMFLGRWDPKGTSATAYAWFVWMHLEAIDQSPLGEAIMACKRVDGNLSIPIPVGTKRRLWRADDPARFGWSPPSELGMDGGQVAGNPAQLGGAS